MGLVHTLRQIVVAAEAAWPYLLIPGVLTVLAGLGQFTDLSRRELRGTRAAVFGVLLGLIQFMDLRWLDRDVVAAVTEEATGLRTLAQALAVGLFLFAHRTNTTKLLGDKVRLDHPETIRLWRAAGYVSIPAVALLANFPLLALWVPSLEKWPLADVRQWRAFDGWVGLVLLALHGLGALVCASERGLRWVAARLASTNLIAAHVLVLGVLIGIAYLRTFANATHLPVFTLGLIAVVLVGTLLNAATRAGRRPGREVPTTDWPDEGLPFPDRAPLLFAAEGGGIHAAYRSATVLAELDHQTEGRFWESLDATSTISGGSVGTGAYVALREEARIAGLGKIRRQAHLVGRSDMLLPNVLRTLFTEPWMLLFPWAKGLDRSKGLEIALSQAVEAADPGLAARRTAPANGSPVDLQLKDLRRDPASGPRHFFNTASVKSGERVVVTTSCIDSARTTLDEGEGISRRSMPLRSAATLSARFPLVSSSGMVRLSPDGSAEPPLFERLIDGGIYDNIGIDVLVKYVRDLRKERPGLKPVVVLVSNNYEAVRNHPALGGEESRSRFGRSKPLEGLLSIVYFALGSLTNRNDDATRELIRMADEGKATVVSFLWSLSAVDAPLGWFMDGSRARLISYMLGCEEAYSLGRAGCFFVDGLDPVPLDGLDVKTLLQGPGLAPENVARIERIRAHNKASLATLKALVATPEALKRVTTIG